MAARGYDVGPVRRVVEKGHQTSDGQTCLQLMQKHSCQKEQKKEKDWKELKEILCKTIQADVYINDHKLYVLELRLMYRVKKVEQYMTVTSNQKLSLVRKVVYNR